MLSPSLRRSTRNRRVVNFEEKQKGRGKYIASASGCVDDDYVYDDYLYDEEDAANALLSLQDSESETAAISAESSVYSDSEDEHADANTSATNNKYRGNNCVNPMTPVVKYAYYFTVSDPPQQHFASSYMIYDEKTRQFHLLNKITLLAQTPATPEEMASSYALLTKYSSHSETSVEAYIFNLLAAPQHCFCISAQFVGLILSDDKLRSLYDANACYYDIDSLMETRSSTETITGDEYFALTPQSHFSNQTFNNAHITSVFDVLSRNK